MDKFSSWFRVVLTWVVIIPDLILSYLYLRDPSHGLEILSLLLNLFSTTVLFYIYMDIYKANTDETTEESNKSASPKVDQLPGLYKLAFGSLIEDMCVWLGLFFLLYNIVPVTLFIHNLISKNL